MQVAGRAPLFCWEEDNNKTGSVVSASHLSCELSPSIPTTFSLTLRAPHIDGVSGEGVCQLRWKDGIYQKQIKLFVKVNGFIINLSINVNF